VERQAVTSIESPAGRFQQLLPELALAVGQRLVVVGGFASEKDVRLVLDYSRRFGDVLAAVYEFGLTGELVSEAGWLGTMLAAHGLDPATAGRVLEGWSVAISSRLPASDAAELVGPLDALRRAGAGAGLASDLVPADEPRLGGEAQAFFVLVTQRRRRAAAELLLAWGRHGRRFVDIVQDAVLPVMADIGRQWAAGRISSADEHAATEVCRYAVLRLADAQSPAPLLDLRALVACVPGEEHSFGAEVVAEDLRLTGWDVMLVGRSAPQDDIVTAAAGFGADVVFLSVTMLGNLVAARELVDALGRAGASGTGRSPGIALGGRAAALAAAKLSRSGVAVVANLAQAHAAGLALAGRDAGSGGEGA
jgi:methanogenic corrinoid protein MtbC1